MLEMRAVVNQLWAALEATVESFFQRGRLRQRVWDLWLAFERHNSARTARAMAFDLFLAMIPMLGLAGAVASQLLHSQTQALVESSRLLDLAPARLRGFLLRNTTAFAETEVAPLFVLLVLWLSSSAFFTMIRVFEESFDCEPRDWLSARAFAFGFATTGLGLFVAATAAGALLTWQGFVSDEQKEQVSSLLSLVPPGLRELELLPALVFATSSLGIAAYLALIYRFAVVRRVKRRSIPGALVATGIGLLGSFLFAYYVTHLSRYALFYGSLAIIVVVLLWLWVWCSAILIGAELNFALENAQAARTSPSTAPPESRSTASGEKLGQGDDGVGPTQTPSAAGNPEGD